MTSLEHSRTRQPLGDFSCWAAFPVIVPVLERTTSRDVRVGVRFAVGEGGRWSAERLIFLYFDTSWALELYNRFPVLRVVALWEPVWRAFGAPLESLSISPSFRSADQGAKGSR